MRPSNLLVTLSNIGDVILTTPVIAVMSARFPDSELTVVSGPKAAPLLAGSRLIHELIIYDKHADLGGQIRFLRKLRRKSYEWAVDLRNTAIPFLVKARRRSPLFRPAGEILKRSRHLEILKRSGFEISGASAFDFFSPEEERNLFSKLRAGGLKEDAGWVVASPVAASALKSWPLSKFREVLSGLLRERSEPIVLAGDEREGRLISNLAELAPQRIFNLAGKTTLRELAALVARASLVLANDSAVMHLGYELDRPVAAIFGPTSHEKYGRTGSYFKVIRRGVECSPCEKAVCLFDRQSCFEDLDSQAVLKACLELLKPSAVSGGLHAR